MSEKEAKKMILPGPCIPPYYPDEDRQLAGELMDIAGKLMEMASRVLKPDHYWKGGELPPDPPPYELSDTDQGQD